MSIVAVRTIETITGEIKALQNSTLACIIEIGRRLCEAKEMLQHGEFGTWLEKEVDFSTSTANNFMRLFEEYGSPQSTLFGAEINSQTLGNLSYTKALKLLAVPEDEREEFVAENDVENMSTRDLDKLIKDLDDAKKAKEAAEKRTADIEHDSAQALAEAQERADKLDGELKEKADTVRELSEQIEELKANPIDVTVAPEPDPTKLQAAIDKAKAEVEKEKKKEIAELEKKLKVAEKEKADAEKARLDALSEKDKLVDEVSAAQSNAKTAERALESLKKAQAMSDPIVTEFKTIFEETQKHLIKLQELASGAGENKERLEKALASMLGTFAASGENK